MPRQNLVCVDMSTQSRLYALAEPESRVDIRVERLVYRPTRVGADINRPTRAVMALEIGHFVVILGRNWLKSLENGTFGRP